jgi:predicted ATPase/class 3 adenylate cyclase
MSLVGDARVLPEGTVSMLFSDIEGSTVLAQRLGPDWEGVLEAQRQVCREAWSTHGGTEMGTEGDSFFVVFGSALDAVGAAVAAQRALSHTSWPTDNEVRVRIGVHTGSPRRHADGYVGTDVHQAARIAACAHGGQIVVSETTAGLVRSGDGSTILPGLSFQDLGEHRVKDIETPLRLFQVGAEGLADEFPTLRSFGGLHNVPTSGSPLVGRETELSALVDWLRAGQGRLVTLTGPGGTGKTRLAIGVAEAVAGEVSDGVRFVSLAPVTTGEAMWSTISQVLELPPDAGVPPEFFEQVGRSDAVWILDNLEQLAEAPEVVGQILQGAPRVRVVATSRSPLHVEGEVEFQLAPLSLPADDSWAEVSSSGAVKFFVQRAAKVRRGFSLTTENAVDVARLCRALDGLPLALDLTAARLKLFNVPALLERIDTVLDVGSTRIGHDGPTDRQRTLRSTIEWSFRLLPDVQQDLLTALSVFAGGAALDAVSSVCGALYDGDEEALVDGVLGLVDSSFLQVRYDTEPTRFTLLETIRRYAQERLDGSGEAAGIRIAYRQHFLDWAHALRSCVIAGESISRRVLLEVGNLRAVVTSELEGLTDPEDRTRPVTPLQAAYLLAGLTQGIYLNEESSEWVRAALARRSPDEDPVGRYACLARLMNIQINSNLEQEALEVAAEAGARYQQIDPVLAETTPSWLNLHYLRLLILTFTADAHLKLGDAVRGREIALDVLTSDGLTDHNRESVLQTLANIALFEEDYDDAARWWTQLRDLGVTTSDSYTLFIAENGLADIAWRRGDLVAALEGQRQATIEARKLTEPEYLRITLGGYALLAAPYRPEVTARILGASEKLREVTGLGDMRTDPLEIDTIEGARSALGVVAWTDAWESGHRDGWEMVLTEMADLEERDLRSEPGDQRPLT